MQIISIVNVVLGTGACEYHQQMTIRRKLAIGNPVIRRHINMLIRLNAATLNPEFVMLPSFYLRWDRGGGIVLHFIMIDW